jgi:FKBP-type peptidyl-prolyl cis-trans isomerase 2
MAEWDMDSRDLEEAYREEQVRKVVEVGDLVYARNTDDTEYEGRITKVCWSHVVVDVEGDLLAYAVTDVRKVVV